MGLHLVEENNFLYGAFTFVVTCPWYLTLILFFFLSINGFKFAELYVVVSQV